MPKRSVNSDAPAFAARLVALLEKQGRRRHGAGAYLARKYKVSTVVANAWLNGEYKPGLKVADHIARDHGSTLDELYFDKKPGDAWPFQRISPSRYWNLTEGQRISIEGRLLGEIVDIENAAKK